MMLYLFTLSWLFKHLMPMLEKSREKLKRWRKLYNGLMTNLTSSWKKVDEFSNSMPKVPAAL